MTIRHLIPLCALFISLILPAGAQGEKEDKIGTVNMDLLFSKYYKTEALRKTFTEIRTSVGKENEEKVKELQAKVKEAEEVKKKTEDTTLAQAKRAELFKSFQAKQQEIQVLNRARTEWARRKQAALVEKDREESGILRSEIIEMLREVVDKEGYDYIFDNSGASGSGGVKVLVYTKDAADLTELILARINRDAPAKEAEAKAE